MQVYLIAYSKKNHIKKLNAQVITLKQIDITRK